MEHTIFTENLKQILIQKGMTQKQLSEKTGIPTSSIASWFGKQRSYPSLEYASLIANALDCSIDYLVGREREDGIIVVNGQQRESVIPAELENIYIKLDSMHRNILIGIARNVLEAQRQGA